MQRHSSSSRIFADGAARRGAFPESLANPALHRWSTGARVGGPVLRNKLFFLPCLSARIQLRPGYGAFAVKRCHRGLPTTGQMLAWRMRSPVGMRGPLQRLRSIPIAAALMNAKLPNGSYANPFGANERCLRLWRPQCHLDRGLRIGDGSGGGVTGLRPEQDGPAWFKLLLSARPGAQTLWLVSDRRISVNPSRTVRRWGVTTPSWSRLNWEQRLGYVCACIPTATISKR